MGGADGQASAGIGGRIANGLRARPAAGVERGRWLLQPNNRNAMAVAALRTQKKAGAVAAHGLQRVYVDSALPARAASTVRVRRLRYPCLSAVRSALQGKGHGEDIN